MITPPTVAEIESAANLRPEQVNARYVSADLQGVLAEVSADGATAVEEPLGGAVMPFGWPFTDAQIAVAYPNYDAGQRSALLTRLDRRATMIARDFALSYLFERSGQLQKAYPEMAKYYAGKALNGLGSVSGQTGLLWQVYRIAAAQTGDTTPGELARPRSRNTRLSIVF